MYNHTSLFRLKQGVTLDKVRAAKEELSQLVETLPGVVHFMVTDNLAENGRGYTLALFSTFESDQAFRICQRHPEYQRVWKDLLEPVIDDRIVAEGSDS